MNEIKERLSGMKLNIKFTIVIVIFVMLPIIILVQLIFYTTSKSMIKENLNYMQYTTQRNQEKIKTNIHSINMVTQFFLSDEGIVNVLDEANRRQTMDSKRLIDFKQSTIASLDRLVNNNSSLYGVRVYAQNDFVQEMMPILYQNSRMKKLDWSKDASGSGWKFDYRDGIFSSYTRKQENNLMSYITPVLDEEGEQIGTIESAMTMKEMFSTLYENVDSEWSCFVSEDGTKYCGIHKKKISESLINHFLKVTSGKTDIDTFYYNKNGKEMVVSCMAIPELSGSLIYVRDISKTMGALERSHVLYVVLLAFIMLLLVILINRIVELLLRKFYRIIASIRMVQAGNLDVVFEEKGNDEMGELGSQINTMLRYIKVLMQENIQREVLVKNSEIKSLQNQINAHFIYNVLESIKMMAEIEEKYEISDSITSLGELLRYSLRWESSMVTVGEEINYIQNYVALMNIRYDFVINLLIQIPKEMYQQEIPKMSLQPIIENAICHGIEEIADDAVITVKGNYLQDEFVIEITDTGVGMTEEDVEQLMQKIHGNIEISGGKGNGIGLKNVQDRIRMNFGEQYGVQVKSKKGCYTKVLIMLPR